MKATTMSINYDFEKYGIHIKGNTSGNIKVLCPQCSHERKKKTDPCLSVNITEGVWHCHNCGWKGCLKDENPMRHVINNLSRRVEKTYTRPTPIESTETAIADAFFKKRCINPSTAYSSSVCAKNDSIAFQYFKDKTLVNVKYRNVNDKRFSQSKNGEPILWRYDDIIECERIIVTEGEMDALALIEAGFDNATSIPCGADKNAADLPEGSTKFDFLYNSKYLIDAAKEIVIWMDNDDAGKAMQDELVRRIGKKKCLYIPDTFGYKDPNDILIYEGVDTLKEVANSAIHYPIDDVITYADAVASIVNFDPTNVQGASTGYPILDKHFRLAKGDLCVITGIPQSGKSEFCDQIILNSIIRSGWKWAYYTPENMPVERHFVRVAEKYTKKPFTQLDEYTRVETVATLSKYINLINPEDGANIDSILDKVDALVYRYGINGFILDPWNEVEHRRDKNLSETEYIGMELQKCRQFARSREIFFIIVAHPTKISKKMDGEYPVANPYDISGSANWRNKPDSCLSVWRSFKRPTNDVEIHIQKMRNKYAGKNGKVDFTFDIDTGVYTEKPKYSDNDITEIEEEWR